MKFNSNSLSVNMLRFIFIVSLLVSIGVRVFYILLVENDSAIGKLIDFIQCLSDGVVVSSLFYYIVNYIPYLTKKKRFEHFLKSKVWDIGERIRQCMDSCRMYDFNHIGLEKQDSASSPVDKTKEREEYIKNFASKDYSYFNEIKEPTEKLSILDSLKGKRNEIRTLAESLLPYSDLLSSSQFDFVSAVLNSEFLNNGLFVPYEGSSTCYDNRETIGAEFYDLHEKSILLN